MDIDNFLEVTGPFGRFQLKVVILCYVCAVMSCTAVLVDVFANIVPPSRCRIALCESEESSYNEEFLNFTTAIVEDDIWEKCSHYPTNNNSYITETPRSKLPNTGIVFSPHNSLSEGNSSQCVSEMFDPDSRTECEDGFIYDKELFTSSSVIEFTLTCDRAGNVAIVNSAYMVGMLIGSPTSGYIGDYFGRRISVLYSILLVVAGGLGSALSPTFWVLVVMRVVTGMGGINLFITPFILAVEYVVPRHRVLVGVMIFVPFALGGVVLTLFAYYVRNSWRLLTILCTTPSILLLGSYWFLPESMRWLREQGRHDEVWAIMTQIVKTNGKRAPEEFYTQQVDGNDLVAADAPSDQKQKLNVLDLMRSPNMRKRCIISYYLWAVATILYYGLSTNSVNLSGDVFVNFCLTSIIEIPSYFLVWLILDRAGRKGSLVFLLLLSGVSCLIAGYSPSDSSAVVIFSLLGKFGAAAAFAGIYVFSSEIFPTEYRSLGVGVCSMCGRIGGILAPLISTLGQLYYKPLALLSFGILALVGTGLLFLMPETAGCILPSTLEESERFGCDQPVFYLPFLRRPDSGNNIENGHKYQKKEIDIFAADTDDITCDATVATGDKIQDKTHLKEDKSVCVNNGDHKKQRY